VSGGTLLDRLAILAREAGATWIADQAGALAERLGEGRFYVVCVGQFKRGKSTLLNALIGVPVLPTGVAPITTAVTVVRHGARLAARVRFGNRDWEECDPAALSMYVSEEHNPSNEKGVVAVEVFAPSDLLQSGMCLVDTPGIGSVSLANTEATRAFVPHVDAALVVLGADPPITRDELDLVTEVAGTVRDIIVVFSKADRLSDAERGEAIRFTRRVLEESLHRPLDAILEVSATERAILGMPLRDWTRLVERLETLARESGSDLVRGAQARETRLLIDALLRELAEQRQALVRPIEESEARVVQLRAAVADAERALADLGHLLTAEQDRLSQRFTAERDRFFASVLPAAQQDLLALIRADPPGKQSRERALEQAREIMRQWVERWRREHEPQAAALYRAAERRFVELANEFQDRLATLPTLGALPRLEVHQGFRVRSHFYHTDLMHVAPASPGVWVLDTVMPWRRAQLVEGAALAYLERLLDVNTARMKNDFEDRVAESRRQLEAEIRTQLHRLARSAERGLEAARRAHAAGAEAVRETLGWLDGLRDRAEACRAEELAS
jgi:GTPase SAR1 family protein